MSDKPNTQIIIRHIAGAKINRIDPFALADTTEITFGREASSTVTFDSPKDDVVSRRHAVLRVKNDGGAPSFSIEDLKSSNGTFVNGEKISSEHELLPDDTVEFGKDARTYCEEQHAIQADIYHRFGLTFDHFGRLDLLVANAGIWEGAPLEEMSEELWDRVIETNLKGTWTVCRAAVPLMRRAGGGSIIVVSSTAGQRGEASYSNYAASKGGQISFAKSLAVELAPEIRINCVAPGWVDTDLNEGVFGEDGFKKKLTEAIPLRRIATADDVALSIVFLASEWAQHITGEVLNVNGGAVLCG